MNSNANDAMVDTSGFIRSPKKRMVYGYRPDIARWHCEWPQNARTSGAESFFTRNMFASGRNKLPSHRVLTTNSLRAIANRTTRGPTHVGHYPPTRPELDDRPSAHCAHPET